MPDLHGNYAAPRMVANPAVVILQCDSRKRKFADASILRRRHTMVAVTYDVTRVPASNAERAKAAAPRKSFFARFMDALVESRLKHVHREIARHAHLLPYTLDERGNRVINGIDKMPFSG
jgi:hypothetical protein